MTAIASETWEIYPRLFLGRVPEHGETFDHDLLVCCETYLPDGVTCRGSVVHVPFADSEDPLLVAEATSHALRLSRDVASRWRAGQSTRISCMAGLNRSGLVMACVLVRLGLEPHDAIDRIRWKRGSMALSNNEFVWWLSTKLENALLAEGKVTP